MISQQIQVDWQVGEEIYESEGLFFSKQRLKAGKEHFLSRGERQVAQTLLRSIFLLLLTTLVGTSQLSTLLNVEEVQLRDGIEESLARESLAWQSDYAPLAERLIDSSVDPQWQRAWRSAWSIASEERSELDLFLVGVHNPADPFSDYAQATVQVSDSLDEWWIASPYRETRFYQQSGDEWLRTLPPQSFWGESESIQLDRLQFTYRAADADTVESVAPHMETLYVALHETLGVHPGAETMTISVIPNLSQPGLPQPGQTASTALEITSPSLSKIPIGLSDADYLAHQIVSQFTAIAYQQAVVGHPNLHLSRWQRMTWALRGWLRTEALQQRTPWHQQADELFAERLAYEWPLPLQTLNSWAVAGKDETNVSQAERMWQYAASESLLTYIEDAYGPESIPSLLEGFGQYPTWKELIPALFDTSLDEFEQGYNRHLAQRYDLSGLRFSK